MFHEAREAAQITEAPLDALFLLGGVSAESARHESVLTDSPSVRQISEGRLPAGADEARATLGQGLPLFQLRFVRDALARRGLADRAGIGDPAARSGQRPLAARPDADPRDRNAHGGHLPDPPMLELVGHPVAAGDDGELRERLPAQAASVRI